jgi:hypothetical protein
VRVCIFTGPVFMAGRDESPETVASIGALGTYVEANLAEPLAPAAGKLMTAPAPSRIPRASIRSLINCGWQRD